MDELAHGTSNPNIKQAGYVIAAESGAYLLSQSSRDQKMAQSNSNNIKNMHLRKYIESREREKRTSHIDLTKAGGNSATRQGAARYINDLVAKSPSKPGKHPNSRKAQQHAYTVKKALD